MSSSPFAACPYEVEVFNPNNLPIEELPTIMAFINVGSPGWFKALAISEDGVVLGAHICSADYYVPNDLGVIRGTRPDRHEKYRNHYPGGYRMEHVRSAEIEAHEKLQNAFTLNRQKGASE